MPVPGMQQPGDEAQPDPSDDQQSDESRPNQTGHAPLPGPVHPAQPMGAVDQKANHIPDGQAAGEKGTISERLLSSGSAMTGRAYRSIDPDDDPTYDPGSHPGRRT